MGREQLKILKQTPIDRYPILKDFITEQLVFEDLYVTRIQNDSLPQSILDNWTNQKYWIV